MCKPLASDGVKFADDRIGPALSFDHLKALALDHLGGSLEGNDVWPCSCGCLHPESHPAHSGVTENQHGRIVHRGTKGSNPLSSTGESANHRSLARDSMVCRVGVGTDWRTCVVRIAIRIVWKAVILGALVALLYPRRSQS
jgi:hypothetical protein